MRRAAQFARGGATWKRTVDHTPVRGSPHGTLFASGAVQVFMTKAMRLFVLRANAIYLVLAAIGGLRADVLGIFFSQGHVGRVVSAAPFAGIGFIEAHGLALILGVVLWRAAPLRSWHLTAVAIHLLLGTANLVFWQIFVAADMLAVGYITTSLHWLFVILQLVAAATARTRASAPAGALT